MSDLVEWLGAALDWSERPVLADHPADRGWMGNQTLATVRGHREILAAVGRWHDPHPGVDCTNADDPWESCELHVDAKRRLPPYALEVLAGIYRESFPGFDPAWIGES